MKSLITKSKLHRTCALICSSALAAGVLTGTAGCAKNKTASGDGKLRDTSAADARFAEGANRAPTAATKYSFARILVGQGKDRDALYVLNRIVREHPKFLPAYNEIAGIYLRSDRVDDAIDALKEGLRYSPKDGVLLNNLGMCHLLQDENEAALRCFTAASDSNPSNPTYRANRATTLALLGRDKEAEREYRTVLGKNPTRENLEILSKARSQNRPAAKISEAAEPEPAFVPTEPIIEPAIAPAAKAEIAIKPTTAPSVVVKEPATAPSIIAKAPATAPSIIAKAPETAPNIIDPAPTTSPSITAKSPASAPIISKEPTIAPAIIAKEPATSPVIAKAPTTAPAIIAKQPTTAPAAIIAKQPTTAPAAIIAKEPTTAPSIVKAPTTAPSIVAKAPTTAAIIAKEPTTVPAIAKAPTTAPIIAKAPTTAPSIAKSGPTTAPTLLSAAPATQPVRSVWTVTGSGPAAAEIKRPATQPTTAPVISASVISENKTTSAAKVAHPKNQPAKSLWRVR